jgi:hypothetical protein
MIVPYQFTIPTPNYPKHNKSLLIEDYARGYFASVPVNSEWEYVPVGWTGYHCSNGYGKNLKPLQDFVNSLPKKKYWTIVQYDDGILVDFQCKTFSCASKGDYPIPVICDRHNAERRKTRYWASFNGNYNVHPIRIAMRNTLMGASGIYIAGSTSTEGYVLNLCQSVFALCPRGYGNTSFRMYEAMALGCIPIYISDIFWLPFQNKIDWGKCSILISENEIERIPGIVQNMSEKEIKERTDYIKQVSDKYFTMSGTCNEIAEIVKTWK